MKGLDLTMDYMENARFNYTYAPALAHMDSTFSKTQLLCLAMIYHKFALQNGVRARYMTVRQLSNILELMFSVTDLDINRRIVARISYDPECLDSKCAPDRYCSLAGFIKLFSLYFSTDLEKRMHFVFSIYDDKDRGYLEREQVVGYVSKFFNGDDEDEIFELRADMTEALFVKFDVDKDMRINYDEYCTIVRTQPMLMEFLGQIFPSENQLNTVRLCINLLS